MGARQAKARPLARGLAQRRTDLTAPQKNKGEGKGTEKGEGRGERDREGRYMGDLAQIVCGYDVFYPDGCVCSGEEEPSVLRFESA